MQERRIQYYDSMLGSGQEYLCDIFRFLLDEHWLKKNTPLPNADEWQLIPCSMETPKQRNGMFRSTLMHVKVS